MYICTTVENILIYLMYKWSIIPWSNKKRRQKKYFCFCWEIYVARQIFWCRIGENLTFFDRWPLWALILSNFIKVKMVCFENKMYLNTTTNARSNFFAHSIWNSHVSRANAESGTIMQTLKACQTLRVNRLPL